MKCLHSYWAPHTNRKVIIIRMGSKNNISAVTCRLCCVQLVLLKTLNQRSTSLHFQSQITNTKQTSIVEPSCASCLIMNSPMACKYKVKQCHKKKMEHMVNYIPHFELHLGQSLPFERASKKVIYHFMTYLSSFSKALIKPDVCISKEIRKKLMLSLGHLHIYSTVFLLFSREEHSRTKLVSEEENGTLICLQTKCIMYNISLELSDRNCCHYFTRVYSTVKKHS